MKNSLLINKAYINGKFVSGTKTFDVINPATGKVIDALPDLSVKECAKAIVAAEKAWLSWRDVPAGERSALIRKWYELILENKKLLLRL